MSNIILCYFTSFQYHTFCYLAAPLSQAFSKPSSGRVYWSIFSLASHPNFKDARWRSTKNRCLLSCKKQKVLRELHDGPEIPDISIHFLLFLRFPRSHKIIARKPVPLQSSCQLQTFPSSSLASHWSPVEGYAGDDLDWCHVVNIVHQLQNRDGQASSCECWTLASVKTRKKTWKEVKLLCRS